MKTCEARKQARQDIERENKHTPKSFQSTIGRGESYVMRGEHKKPNTAQHLFARLKRSFGKRNPPKGYTDDSTCGSNKQRPTEARSSGVVTNVAVVDSDEES